MHLIECDGCKKLETYIYGIAKEEAVAYAPEGWGWRQCAYYAPKYGTSSVLLHACNVRCAPLAFIRAKMQLVQFSGKLGADYSQWQGFYGATRSDKTWLLGIPPEEGGQIPPKEAPKSKPKVPKTAAYASWVMAADESPAAFTSTPSMEPLDEEPG